MTSSSCISSSSSGSSLSASVIPNKLPRSLRGAPAHLRDAIRRQQNAAAARRTRARRKARANLEPGLRAATAARADRLRRRVCLLEAAFVAAGLPVPAEAPRLPKKKGAPARPRAIPRTESPPSQQAMWPDPPLMAASRPYDGVPGCDAVVPDPLGLPAPAPAPDEAARALAEMVRALAEGADILSGVDVF